MQAPFAATTATTPGGTTSSVSETVSVTLQDTSNPLSVTALTRRLDQRPRLLVGIQCDQPLDHVDQRRRAGIHGGPGCYRPAGAAHGLQCAAGVLPVRRGRTPVHRDAGCSDDDVRLRFARSTSDHHRAGFPSRFLLVRLSNRVVGETLPGGLQVVLGQDASGKLTSVAPQVARPTGSSTRWMTCSRATRHLPPRAPGSSPRPTPTILDGALTQVLLPDESTIVPTTMRRAGLQPSRPPEGSPSSDTISPGGSSRFRLLAARSSTPTTARW